MPIDAKLILEFLSQFAPLQLAEDWDNVGLLVGVEHANVERVMTCLTVTPDVVREAIETETNLIVAHHPVMFRPLKKLTNKTVEGQMLLDLISNGIAVYSPHTAFDSAVDGINQRLANDLGLNLIRPIRTIQKESLPEDSGSGRYGELSASVSLREFLNRAKEVLQVTNLQYVGDLDATISKVAVACGAAAEYLTDARDLGCDVLLTGEARFHGCLEARSTGIALIVAGHYVTERPAVEALAEIIAQEFPSVSVSASRVENDPLKWSVS